MSDDTMQPPDPSSATLPSSKKRRRHCMKDDEVFEYLTMCEKYQVLNPKANQGSLQLIKERALTEYEGSQYYKQYKPLSVESNWGRMQTFARKEIRAQGSMPEHADNPSGEELPTPIQEIVERLRIMDELGASIKERSKKKLEEKKRRERNSADILDVEARPRIRVPQRERGDADLMNDFQNDENVNTQNTDTPEGDKTPSNTPKASTVINRRRSSPKNDFDGIMSMVKELKGMVEVPNVTVTPESTVEEKKEKLLAIMMLNGKRAKEMLDINQPLFAATFQSVADKAQAEFIELAEGE
ncbi:hypothetical protein TrCOL_g12178 [Triparma columacea]|uniref:Uncharacterized protein n=1 Tax=Triparma columacea TaxID=722753 RepID=A0A9W7L4X7_9STRA|nr:hypothetical protein TrCOL_g12178 [Triparma columacea]